MDAACRDVTECLSEYLDGELSADSSRTVGAHLAQCKDCATLRDTLRSINELSRRLPPLPIPPDVQPPLRELVRSTSPSPSPP